MLSMWQSLPFTNGPWTSQRRVWTLVWRWEYRQLRVWRWDKWWYSNQWRDGKASIISQCVLALPIVWTFSLTVWFTPPCGLFSSSGSECNFLWRTWCIVRQHNLTPWTHGILRLETRCVKYAAHQLISPYTSPDAERRWVLACCLSLIYLT